MSYQTINEIQTAFSRLAKLEQQQAAKEAKHRDALKRRRLSRFIRVKEELDKTAILKEAAAIKTPIHGLSITAGGETLSIEVGA